MPNTRNAILIRTLHLYFGICHLSAATWTSWMGNTAALQRSGHIMNYIVYILAFFLFIYRSSIFQISRWVYCINVNNYCSVWLLTGKSSTKCSWVWSHSPSVGVGGKLQSWRGANTAACRERENSSANTRPAAWRHGACNADVSTVRYVRYDGAAT